MAKREEIPFDGIAGAARNCIDSLLGQWLPHGARSGSEYAALNPTRADSAKGSFSVSVSGGNAGVWSDFATGDRGGDLISLYAYLFGSSNQAEAAIEVADAIGYAIPDGCRPKDKAATRKAPVVDHSKVKPKPVKAVEWSPTYPLAVPDDAPEPPVAHVVRGKPEMTWCYRDADGGVLGYVYRFKTSDGGKETLPLTYCKHLKTGAFGWRWMQWPAPSRPMYGIDRLAHNPDAWVLLVEGEKCADAAAALLTNTAVVSWSGGTNAVGKIDWSPLAGRNIYAWSDCDAKRKKLTPDEVKAGVDPSTKDLLPEYLQPGVKAMLKIREILRTEYDHDAPFHFVDIPKPGDRPDGWDVADLIAEGADRRVLSDMAANVREPVVPTDGNAVSAGENSPRPISGEGESNVVPLSVVTPSKQKVAKPEKVVDWDRFNALCEHYVLIYSTDTVFDLRTKMIMKVNALRLAFGAEYVKMWLNSDQRQMIKPDELVFDPAQISQPPCINLYDGMAVVPKNIDVSPITDLVEHLCGNCDSPTEFNELVHWVVSWLAYPLQHPGAKMQTAMVFHGPQGAGKNLLFEIVEAIYGKYGSVVGQDQLESDFNEWASQKLFIIGDEVVARSELYHQKNKLKAFITGTTIQINPKGLPLRTEANHCNVVFLSNEHQPMALEVGDRRYMVVYTPPQRVDDLYAKVHALINGGDGVAGFYHFLLHYDLGDFKAHTLPPMTSAKQELIELNLRPEEQFAYKWMRDEIPLPLMVCSTAQLYEAFLKWARLNGSRFMPDQTQFTSKLTKTFINAAAVNGGAPFMVKKKVRMPKDSKPASEYIWIPDGCAPNDGVTIGEWAESAIADFKADLAGYGRQNVDD